MKGGTKAPIAESPAEISVEAATTGNAYAKEHSDISHLLFAIDIQIHNVLQGSTTDFPYSLSYSDLVAISQALEEIKDLREHLMLYRNFCRDSNIAMKESSEDEEFSIDAASKSEEEVMSSAMDTLLKVVADYDAEIERLTQDSRVLREQVKKLASSNESLVKQNIALRRQTRDLKNASISGMPSASSSRTFKHISSAGAQGSDTAVDSPNTEICAFPEAEQMESPLFLQSLPRIPNTSGLAKFKERLGKLLGSWKAGKHEPPKSVLTHNDKDKQSRKRQPICGKPSKLRKKRISSNEKTISNSSKTSACVGQRETLLETTTADPDDRTRQHHKGELC